MSEEIIDESKYTRVTTPLSRYAGYQKVPVAILDYAADRGTRVHKYAELYAQGMLFGDIDLDCFEYVQAFIQWFDENVTEVISQELRMYCDTLLIQGQCDMIAKVKGYRGNTLVDLKTSLNYSKTWNLQTAAYKYLCTVNERATNDRLVVQVKKDGTFETYCFDAESYSEERETYRAVLKAHRFFS